MVKKIRKYNTSGLVHYKPGDPKAVENGRKGGKNKGIWAKVAMRKYCSKRCPIYERCPFAHIAQNTEGKPCLLNKWNKQNARKLVKILEKQESGFDEVLSSFLAYLYMEIMVKYSDNIKLKRKLLYDIINVKKAIFGERKEVNLEGSMNVDMETILKKVKTVLGIKEDE